MKADLVIKNCQIVNPQKTILGHGVVVHDEKIIGIEREADLPDAEKVIDAKGNHLLPGAIDPHTHFGFYTDPRIAKGFDVECQTGTQGGLFGGITSAIMMNTLSSMMDSAKTEEEVPHPPDREMFEEIKKNIEKNSVIDLALRPWIRNHQDVADIPYYADVMGIGSFKFRNDVFPGSPTNKVTGFHGVDNGTLIAGMEAIKKVGGIACMHNEDPYIIKEYTARIRKQVEEEGRTPVLEDWTAGRPSVAEYEALKSNITLAQGVGIPFYGVHTSPKESIDHFAKCKDEGLEVYCEVVSHHIIFNKHSRFVNDPDGWIGLTIVPFRDKEDQDRIWEGITEGIVDCYGSDHVEGIPGQKAIMWDRDFGNSEVEIHYPCMLSEGVNKNRITINKLVEIAAENPARVFGLYPQKGHIGVGADADMVIVDLNEEKTVTYDLFPTLKNSITLYEGMTLKGWPTMTFVRGNVAMENGKITAKMGTGRYLTHKYSGYLRH